MMRKSVSLQSKTETPAKDRYQVTKAHCSGCRCNIKDFSFSFFFSLTKCYAQTIRSDWVLNCTDICFQAHMYSTIYLRHLRHVFLHVFTVGFSLYLSQYARMSFSTPLCIKAIS